MRARKGEEAFFKGLMLASLLLVMTATACIIGVIVYRGAPALSLSMLTETPRGGYYLGGGGGIANAIVGSLYLSFGGAVFSLLLSLPIAFALQKEYIGRRMINLTRLVLDILWGVPSIVYGAFGFVIMVYFGFTASMLGGIIALALLMLPIMTRSMEEAIRMVPLELKEISYAMGATRIETTLSVVLRQALPGIITGILLAFGRGIGDAASLLFTTGYTDYMPGSILDPVASLPLAIFFQIGTPIAEVQQRAYASALILLILVLIVIIFTRLLGSHFSKFTVR
jgi:phosphate transport system permease protein